MDSSFYREVNSRILQIWREPPPRGVSFKASRYPAPVEEISKWFLLKGNKSAFPEGADRDGRHRRDVLRIWRISRHPAEGIFMPVEAPSGYPPVHSAHCDADYEQDAAPAQRTSAAAPMALPKNDGICCLDELRVSLFRVQRPRGLLRRNLHPATGYPFPTFS